MYVCMYVCLFSLESFTCKCLPVCSGMCVSLSAGELVCIVVSVSLHLRYCSSRRCFSLFLFLCLSLYLCLSLSVWLSGCQSVSLCLSLSMPLSLKSQYSSLLFILFVAYICLFLCISVILFNYLSVILYDCLSVSACFYLNLIQEHSYVFVYICLCPSVHLSPCLCQSNMYR